MNPRFDGPEFMKPHFNSCPQELKSRLPEHNVHQGIQCTCGNQLLRLNVREGIPAVFALCERCENEFKLYVNADYKAGYIPDNPTMPQKTVLCTNCRGQIFQVGVGYEYPGDEVDDTDITWFTMIGKCSSCSEIQLLFEDETG